MFSHDRESLNRCQKLSVCLCRLLFQCRYSATAVEALVVEVNTVPPPPPVAAPGPLRVELRLANGQCVTKGCAEGSVLVIKVSFRINETVIVTLKC